VGVREGLLALLAAEPAYGYRLKTSFEAATGGVWPLNVGQVYTTLDRLERDGLVKATERGGQRSYRITGDGVRALGAWWETVPVDEPPARDELVLKVMMAVSAGPEHALDVITRQRTALMQALQRARRTAVDDTVAAAMVADALVVRAEADLRWLDLCEERLTPPRPRGTRARRGGDR
jgi:DNA-binding PadR family transcriptional regulator